MIVIVKSSPLNPLYKDLPVVIVNDWKEISPENLVLWRDRYRDLLLSGDYKKKLTNAYWIEQFRSLQQRYNTL